MAEASILIVDDDPGIRETLSDIFQEKGYKVTTAGTGQEALDKTKKTNSDIALIDIKLPDMDGTKLLKKLKKISPEMKYCIITGHVSVQNAIEALKDGASGYFVKPLVMDEVIHRVEEALEKQSLQRELRESEEKYSTLVEKGNDGIVIIQEGLLKFVNSKLLEISGFTMGGMIGKSFIDFVSPEFRELVSDRDKKRISGEKVPNRYETEILSKDGQKIPVEINTSLIEFGSGTADMAIIRNITKRKRLEAELKNNVKQLEQSNKLKEVFADILRHDLLNPLGIIQNATEMMMDRDHSQEEKIELKMIQKNINKLQSLIDDASEYAKLESIDKLDFEKDDLSIIVRDAIKRVEYLAKEKDTKIVNKIDKKHFTLVNPFLEDVFTNILGNAIKYSPEEGRVVVDIEDDKKDWRLMVKDFGNGIPDMYKENIFHRFERVDKEGTKGTGLGLAIASRIVKLHNGGIWVEDNPEGGSIFYINLPKA